MVLVEVGPYASRAVKVWVSHVRSMLIQVSARRHELPFRLPDEAIEQFVTYLDEWARTAENSDVFHWKGKIAPAELRTFLTYWLNLARAASDRRDIELSPPSTAEFYPGVVSDLVSALESEQEHCAFAARLREHWPELADSTD